MMKTVKLFANNYFYFGFIDYCDKVFCCCA